VLADKEPSPGTHEESSSRSGSKGVGSTVHCIAGDASGIIAAAGDYGNCRLADVDRLIVEYAAGFSPSACSSYSRCHEGHARRVVPRRRTPLVHPRMLSMT